MPIIIIMAMGNYKVVMVIIMAVKGRKRSGLIRLVISLECFAEISPDFLCPFMND